MNPIRWMFYFDQGHIEAKVENTEEDFYVSKAISKGKDGFVLVQEGKPNIYINLDKVKCITREEILPLPVVEPVVEVPAA